MEHRRRGTALLKARSGSGGREISTADNAQRRQEIRALLPRPRSAHCDRPVVLCCVLLLAIAWTGCVSKAKANAQARAAFAAGQQQALIRMQQTAVPNITVRGTVRNPLVPWTPELTVGKAIVAAEYIGKKDPTEIIVVRRSQAFRIDPKQLFNGNDPPLETGDIIELRSEK